MPGRTPYEELKRRAIEHADALCDLLDGEWTRIEPMHSEATITDGERKLLLHTFEQNGQVRLSIEASLPDGWSSLDNVALPTITVGTHRTPEAITGEVTRRLFPAHAETAAAVHAALTAREQRSATSSVLVEHFTQHLPGAVPDLHHPATAAASSGPGPFGARVRVGYDAQTVDLHLRNVPVALSRSLIELIGTHFKEVEEPSAGEDGILDRLADAITAFASARTRLPLDRLERETALNILILARIVSNLQPDKDDREQLDRLTHELVTALRHLAWQHPNPAQANTLSTER